MASSFERKGIEAESQQNGTDICPLDSLRRWSTVGFDSQSPGNERLTRRRRQNIQVVMVVDTTCVLCVCVCVGVGVRVRVRLRVCVCGGFFVHAQAHAHAGAREPSRARVNAHSITHIANLRCARTHARTHPPHVPPTPHARARPAARSPAHIHTRTRRHTHTHTHTHTHRHPCLTLHFRFGQDPPAGCKSTGQGLG